MEQKIIGYYKDWILAEKGGTYYLVIRSKKKILLKGNENFVTRAFGLLVAGSFTEEVLEQMKLEA